MRDSLTVVDKRVDVALVRDTDKRWRRIGQCKRCGECCKSGDPFAPRVPRSARERPCSYLVQVGDHYECSAMAMADPPERVRRYLELACRKWPTRPRDIRPYPNCGFSFELIDGD